MQALVISPDPALRHELSTTLRTLQRRTGERWGFLEATDGIEGLRIAWKELPEVVVADEIASRAGAFAVAKDLKGAERPFPGIVIVILARALDDWLAKWSGADAWFTKPVDPFALSDTVLGLLEPRLPRKETV